MSPLKPSNTNMMWGGRFETGPSALMEDINASIKYDQRMWRQDIIASQAHCQMLIKQNIISAEDGEQILQGLEEITQELQEGRFEFRTDLEDIHMNIESRLSEKIGSTAGRLHTARSRNDQVATDFRLWLREHMEHIDEALTHLQKALVTQASNHVGTIMPGFTHLQTAQPVTFGHHMMAYVEMIARDKTRLSDGKRRLNECPLGVAALAGTSFPVDRTMTAHALAFDHPMANSLDAVSARDFALEFLSIASIIAMHMSRLAEEIVIWSSAQFNFIKISDQFSTGSSIMPQKRNPDAAELVRAKPGRIYGALMGLLTVMKGLPLAYSKDMQEDKEAVFDTVDTLNLIIAAMTGMIEGMSVHSSVLLYAAESRFSTATDLADWLVRKVHIPFRDAHHITGRAVKCAEENSCKLNQLSLSDLQAIDPRISEDVFTVLSVENSTASRNSYGGTAPSQVQQQVERWQELLSNKSE